METAPLAWKGSGNRPSPCHDPSGRAAPVGNAPDGEEWDQGRPFGYVQGRRRGGAPPDTPYDKLKVGLLQHPISCGGDWSLSHVRVLICYDAGETRP